jgi:hypothetical protein
VAKDRPTTEKTHFATIEAQTGWGQRSTPRRLEGRLTIVPASHRWALTGRSHSHRGEDLSDALNPENAGEAHLMTTNDVNVSMLEVSRTK